MSLFGAILSRARLFVTNLNSVSVCISLGLFFLVSLSFHAVAREAGRMRSLAAAEGHSKKN